MKPKAIALARPADRAVPTLFGMFWALVLSAALVLAQAIAAEARTAPESFADLAEMVSPAVVNITTSTVVAGPTGLSPIGGRYSEPPLQ